MDTFAGRHSGCQAMKKICAFILVIIIVLSAVISFGAEGFMTGMFEVKAGKPMSGGLMLVYSPSTGPAPSIDKYWRVPDHYQYLKDDGSIRTDIPEGIYYFGAILRQSGASRIGPPEDGDFFLISLDESGAPKRHHVIKGEHLDLGTLGGARQIKTHFVVAARTVIEGNIQGADGKPVEGAMVFAFLTPKVTGKPLFASERSSKEGKFVLSLPEGGIYYIKVRDDFGGGPPQRGKLVDRDKDEPLLEVSVETGKTAQAGVMKVKKFSGRGRNDN